jgi:hypothetical protein
MWSYEMAFRRQYLLMALQKVAIMIMRYKVAHQIHGATDLYSFQQT